MKNFITSMLSAHKDSISSKRVMGVLAWLCVLGCYVYCSYTHIDMPEGTDTIIYAASAMLGIDSVANAFKKDKED